MGTSKTSWVEKPERFINPYTFAALGGEVERSERAYGDLTGKIRCRLTVQSPLAVPDAASRTAQPVKQDNHFTSPFFRVNDVPTIPGSQLRGVIRSSFETLSNSCLSVNNNNILSARHASPRLPGLLQHTGGRWHLYAARKISEKFAPSKLEDDQVFRTWYDIRGHELKTFVFSNTGEEIHCEGLKEAVKDYQENVELYKDGAYFKKYRGKLTYQIRDDGKLYPVFYEIVKGKNGESLVYLSPSQIGRSVFSNKLDDLLGSHRSCARTKGETLCKACALFGTITDKGGQSYAGQVRFSDASAVDGTFRSEKGVTLKELSSPKTTSTEFYTKRPEKAKTWTYDYKTTAYLKQVVGKRSTTVPQRSLENIQISGRKFYYHAPDLKKSDYSTSEKTKRNESMELCQPGAVFTFDVYFERITQEQLHQLVWTLTLGENTPDSPRQHKLGHGKPLGLGDVKITVDGIETRRFDRRSYTIEQLPAAQFTENCPFDTEDAGVQEYLQIVNIHTLEPEYAKGYRISYPLAGDMKGTTNSGAHHQWFIANRSTGEGGTSTAWSVKYALPRVGDADRSLPRFDKDGEQPSEQHRSGNNRGGGYSGPTTFGGNFTNGIHMKEKPEKRDRKKKK